MKCSSTYLFFLLITLLPAACRSHPNQTPPGRTLPNHTPSPPLYTPTPPHPYTSRPLPPLPRSSAPPLPVPPSPTPTPAYPIYTGRPLDRDDFGVQVHIHREDLDAVFAHLRTLNVGWVKVQVSWKLYQPEPARLDDFLFTELDRLVALAAANDVKVLLGVAKAPEWSRPVTELDGPPTDSTRYRAFMELLAARYRGRVAAYELWNEPNLQREWNGYPLDAADFVELVRAGAAGVRAADPAAILVSGAPAVTGVNDGVVAIDDRLYLQQMVAAGILDVIDAVGAHPYGWANPPGSRAADPDQAAPTHNDHPSFFFADTLLDYRAILDQAGRAEMPIWVTEFGWGSFEGVGGPPPAGVEFMANVSEWQQATYTLRAYELASQWPGVGPLFLWNLNFGPLLGPDYSETGFSLLRPDASPRPIYYSLSTIPKK